MEGYGGEEGTARKGQAAAGCSETALCGAVPLVVTGRSGTGRSDHAAWKGGSSTRFSSPAMRERCRYPPPPSKLSWDDETSSHQ